MKYKVHITCYTYSTWHNPSGIAGQMTAELTAQELTQRVRNARNDAKSTGEKYEADNRLDQPAIDRIVAAS